MPGGDKVGGTRRVDSCVLDSAVISVVRIGGGVHGSPLPRPENMCVIGFFFPSSSVEL